jgi:hypothetical protein
LREAAITNQPWAYSTGPKTHEGKARAAINGKARQTRSLSIRELRELTVDVRVMAKEMARLRNQLTGIADH